MSYYLFLDDWRYPPKSWDTCKSVHIARSYDEFVRAILFYGLPDFISFDHDLGSTSIYGAYETGYDCAKYLVNWLMDRDRHDYIGFTVHSENPVGATNIDNLLKNWNHKGRLS